MNSEDRGYFDSVRTDSFRNTERDEKETKSKFSKKTKLPSLSGKLSPFLYSAPKDYAHLALQSPNTGRSMSSNVEASEVRTLNEGLSVDTRKKIPGFTSDTEEWSATNRPEEENKQDFTFHEHTDEGGDTNRIASIAVVEDERLTKTKKKKKTKTGESEPNEHVESHGNEVIEQKTPKKKKKKKTQTLESLDAAVQKRLSDDMVVHVHKSPEEKPKKKKSKKDGTSKKKTKKQEESKDSKERNGTEKSLEIIVNPLRNLSITSHGTPGHDHKGIVLTESISFIGSPQSTMALNKDMSVKGDDDMRSESCSSPLGPSPFSVKNSKKKKLDTKDKKEKKDKKGKKDKMKMYKLDGNSDEKPKKIKEKKPKQQHHHHNHHSHKPKRVLLTDGLNLVKILTDRTNCKKTKLIILLYTFTVLWSIVLNGLELAFVASSGCKIYTETGMIYLCFTIMAILKFLSVTLFNLELTFKQPYKTTSCLLYPLLIQCFSPLLQLPQNIYDFHNCESANRIIPVKTSWEFLQAVIGSIIGMLLYIGIKKRTNIEVVKSRIGSLISKTFKFLVVIAAIGWNLVLIIVFIAQREIFLPSFFFDFYLYLVLLISTAILYRANRRLGEDGMKAWFIKDEKQLNQPLTQIKVDGQKEKKEEKKEAKENKENHPHIPLDETHQKHTEEEQPEQKEDVEDKETLEKLERIKKKIANIQPLEIKIR